MTLLIGTKAHPVLESFYQVACRAKTKNGERANARMRACVGQVGGVGWKGSCCDQVWVRQGGGGEGRGSRLRHHSVHPYLDVCCASSL